MSTSFSVDFSHRVVFTRGLFQTDNPTLATTLRGGAPKLLAIVDDGVMASRPQLESQLRAALAAHEGTPGLVELCVVRGGEACKNDRGLVDLVVERVNRHHLCRRSWVLAIGGGAVLDAVGYGAAIAHRGVRLVRAPSTVLAQDDAGVGVKNGINRFGKKNFEGVFAVPWAVLNDTDLLTTLPDRFWRGGFSEAVKIALLKDRSFFEQIERTASQIRDRDMTVALPIIRRCCELHVDHIVRGRDPFESLRARPLDFGHWSAHKLEQLTGNSLSHGEAVAIGIALDTLYSVELGWLDRSEADRVLACFHSLGLETWHDRLADPALLAGLEEFREHLGGTLSVTLLRGIAQPEEASTIDQSLITRSISALRDIGQVSTRGAIDAHG